MKISWAALGLGLILLASFLTMFTASREESAIMDELAHIPAGYGYVKFLDYRLNPEHPPLVKIVSAIPLAFLDLNFPTGGAAWQDDVNGQWAVGAQFLYESGNSADKIIQWARIGPMILTLILISFVYLWSRALMGPRWAFLPAILTAFSPTILAHGHYVTTDIGAALGVIIALYFFVKFLTQSSRRNLVFAGLAFGFAQLLKFSAVILIPYFLILAAVFWGISNHRNLREAWRISRSVILVFLIGFALVYPFYLLTTVNYPIEKQASDTEFILGSFASGPPAPGETCAPIRCVAEFNIWMADKPLLRPMAQYMLGILMVVQRSAGGNTAYFLGEVSASGSPLYFPAVYLMKESLPVLIFMVLALLHALYRTGRAIKKRRFNFADYSLARLPELSMLLFIIIYGVYSITSPLNIGVRHLLPIMPLAYILTAAGIKGSAEYLTNLTRLNLVRLVRLALVGLLMLWFLISVGRTYPHYLSYFNETIGTDNGWRYVTDSNYDWGQDLKRLEEFVGNPPAGEKIDKIAIEYFGGGSPIYYLGDKAVPWQSAKGSPKESGIQWLAVSVGFLQNAKGELHPGQTRNPQDEYRWLENYQEPYARAGKSIFIYKLD
ncbi:MAG: glycosyltransferase family 39 protein [Candidatus Colwellbacteria bacterium]